MYSTCLYCNGQLGTNEVIETFPVGRRLAFDSARGRLWVVCRRCEKWNLTPFEERWEAMEQCERLYRDARKRVSSDNVGLARLNEGLELVRIGEPMRPEFAAWRYGDQFGRRHRRMILLGTGAAAVGGGLLVAGAVTGVLSGGGYGLWQLLQYAAEAARRRRVIAVVTAPDGTRITVRGADADRSTFTPPAGPGDPWGLLLRHGRNELHLRGDDARRATARIMPKVNAGGASRTRVQSAVQRIESVGDPQRYLDEIARRPPPPARRRRARGPAGIARFDLETRLAVEMAVNEENERIALAGELALLELEWKDAEELAAIADTLGLPREIDEQIETMRARTRGDDAGGGPANPGLAGR